MAPKGAPVRIETITTEIEGKRKWSRRKVERIARAMRTASWIWAFLNLWYLSSYLPKYTDPIIPATQLSICAHVCSFNPKSY